MAAPKGRKRRPKPVDKTGRGGGQWIQLPYGMVHHAGFRALSGPAVKVWLERRSRYNGGNNGRLTLSYREAADLLSMGKTTAQRAFAELERAGFIALVTEGDWYGRKAHEWSATDIPQDGKHATRDWQHRRVALSGESETQNTVLRRDSSEG